MRPNERAEVRRQLLAPPQRVFAAFSSAEIAARWLTPSPDVRLSVLELDFRERGRYRFAYDTEGWAGAVDQLQLLLTSPEYFR